MKDYLPMLAACPTFSAIPAKELSSLLSCLSAQLISYKKGAMILRQGDPAKLFGVLISGSAQIVLGDGQGSHAIIAHIRQSELFGEAFACSKLSALPVSVVAAQDSTVLLLEIDNLLSGCSKGCPAHARLLASILQDVSMKNLRLTQKLLIVMQRTTRAKLLAYLAGQQNLAGSSSFSIPLDRQALADYLGVERSAMCAQLARMKKEGLLDYHKNRFTLLTPYSSPEPAQKAPAPDLPAGAQ